MRSILAPLMVGLLAATVLAGCFAAPSDDADEDEAPRAVEYYLSLDFPADLDHDHRDPAEHAMSHNVEFVAYHSCEPDGAYRAGMPGFTDIKERGDFLYVNRHNGLCILDISDPTNLSFVSHFTAPMGFDVDVSLDGRWAFHATQRNPPTGQTVEPMAPEDDLPRGLYVIDVSDKAAPRFESFYPVPTNGVHTVHYHKHQNGDDLLLIQTYDWMPPAEMGVPLPVPSVNAPATQRSEITRLVEGPNGVWHLELLAVYSLPKPTQEPFGDYFPHDCTAQQHPFTGRTYMYCAYWNHGMVIVDITNPRQPVLVSQYEDVAPSRYNQYHYVLPSDQLIEDRHITVGAPELQQGVGEAGYIRVFDTTDPANPEQLGAWTLPGVPGFEGGFLFSPHQFDLLDGKIYMGHNHGGVWVLDISNEENLYDPKAAAFYFPTGDERLPLEDRPRMGQVWVAVEHRGFIYASDSVSGITVHRYVHDEPYEGDPGPEWLEA